MSWLSGKIAATRKRGEDRRKTWTPAAEGLPLRIYQWWVRVSGNEVEHENFCRYWRVVLIWAPLLLVRQTAKRMLRLHWVWGLIFALILATSLCVAWLRESFPEACTAILLVYAGIGILIGGDAYVRERQEAARQHTRLEKRDDVPLTGFWKMLIRIFLPPMWVGYLLVQGLTSGPIAKPWKKFSGFVARILNWIFDDAWDILVVVFRAAVIVIGSCGIGALLIVIWRASWLAGLIVTLVAATAALCVIYPDVAKRGLGYILGPVTRRREAKERAKLRAEYDAYVAQVEPVLKMMFDYLHPRETADEERYASWRGEYLRQLEQSTFNFGYDAVVLHQLWPATADWIPVEFRGAVRAKLKEIYAPSSEPRQRVFVIPAPVKAAGRGSWDLVKLIWMVVLVRKWRICPIVEIPNK